MDHRRRLLGSQYAHGSTSRAGGNLKISGLQCAATPAATRTRTAAEMGMATTRALQLEDEFEVADKPAGPCVMVVFGAAGELTKNKQVAALFKLGKEKKQAQKFA